MRAAMSYCFKQGVSCSPYRSSRVCKSFRHRDFYPDLPVSHHTPRAVRFKSDLGHCQLRRSATVLENPAVSIKNAGSVKLERVESEANELTVKGILDVSAAPKTVYELLVAYDKGADVYRDVVESKLLEESGNQKVVVQVCQWSFLAFSGTFSTQLRIEEFPQDLSLAFTLMDSALLKSFRGSWRVAPAGPNRSEVEYTLTVEPHMVMPGPIKAAVRSAFNTQAELLLRDLSIAVLKHEAAKIAYTPVTLSV